MNEQQTPAAAVLAHSRARRLSMPQVLHHLYAAALGYFWTDCPLCRTPFGGHQWKPDRKPIATIPTGQPNVGTAICPSCARAGLGHR